MREIAGNIFRPGEIKRNELVIRSLKFIYELFLNIDELALFFLLFCFFWTLQGAARWGSVHEADVEEAGDVVRLRGDRTEPHLQQQICGQNEMTSSVHFFV